MPTRFRSIYPININISPEAYVCHRHCSWIAIVIGSVMVHRIPTNGIFKFEYAPIMTYFLLVQSQHDTVPCIQPAPTSERRVMLHCNSSWMLGEYICNYDGVIVHRMPQSNWKDIQIQTCASTNVLPARPKPTRYRSIYSSDISVYHQYQCSVFEWQASVQLW